MSKRLILSMILAAALVGTMAMTGCNKAAETPAATNPAETPAAEVPAVEPPASATGSVTADVTELKIEDVLVGKGAEAKNGDTVSVDYTGWLADGTKFDSSLDRGKPYDFVLGAGEVVEGWDKGIAGMKVGGKRKLIIPPAMGYGAEGREIIPPNATLVFDVELMAIK